MVIAEPKRLTSVSRKILFVVEGSPYGLAGSYQSAAAHLGHEFRQFDVDTTIGKYTRFGKAGKILHRFFPVDAWIRKMNRELVITATEYKPDFLFYFTTCPILYGTLATIKTISPATNIVWVWPDTPLNLKEHNVQSARLVDVTATYSLATVPVFTQLGFNNVRWAPLGADPYIYKNEIAEGQDFRTDISFVGGWRPERERVMTELVYHFGTRSIEIHGPLWKRNCREALLKKYICSEGILGPNLSRFFNKCRINVNPIDDTSLDGTGKQSIEIEELIGQIEVPQHARNQCNTDVLQIQFGEQTG